MDIPLAAARSAAPCMGAATVRGPPGKRRDVDVMFELVNLRLTFDAIEFKNHVNGHIKSLLVIFNEMLTTSTLNKPRFPERPPARQTRPLSVSLYAPPATRPGSCRCPCLPAGNAAAARRWR